MRGPAQGEPAALGGVTLQGLVAVRVEGGHPGFRPHSLIPDHLRAGPVLTLIVLSQGVGSLWAGLLGCTGTLAVWHSPGKH